MTAVATRSKEPPARSLAGTPHLSRLPSVLRPQQQAQQCRLCQPDLQTIRCTIPARMRRRVCCYTDSRTSQPNRIISLRQHPPGSVNQRDGGEWRTRTAQLPGPTCQRGGRRAAPAPNHTTPTISALRRRAGGASIRVTAGRPAGTSLHVSPAWAHAAGSRKARWTFFKAAHA